MTGLRLMLVGVFSVTMTIFMVVFIVSLLMGWTPEAMTSVAGVLLSLLALFASLKEDR